MAATDALTRQKMQLVENMRRLSSTEHDEVFKLIRQKKIKFTQNSNGVWCDLFSVDADTIQKMSDLVDFYCCNKVELDEFEQRLAEAKMKNNVHGCGGGGTVFDNGSSSVQEDDDMDSVLSMCDKQAKKALQAPQPQGPTGGFGNPPVGKKTTARFMLAKKRYSKRSAASRGVEADDELCPE
jgi:hypothetical protein